MTTPPPYARCPFVLQANTYEITPHRSTGAFYPRSHASMLTVCVAGGPSNPTHIALLVGTAAEPSVPSMVVRSFLSVNHRHYEASSVPTADACLAQEPLGPLVSPAPPPRSRPNTHQHEDAGASNDGRRQRRLHAESTARGPRITPKSTTRATGIRRRSSWRLAESTRQATPPPAAHTTSTEADAWPQQCQGREPAAPAE
jgi:hypothetical protein